jgi:arsenite methyltransferase
MTKGRSMTASTRRLDTTDLKARINRMYEEVATEPDQEFHFETGRGLAERLGYPLADLDRIPAAAIDSFAGVGYLLDLATFAEGETVLDPGSGSGMDSFLAALAVGPAGTVIGVDMTPAQLAKARALATDWDNVTFCEGYIERPPVQDGTCDCVISNGVINLVPDKHAVFAAAAKSLRPGGRLAIADIVTDVQLPDGKSATPRSGPPASAVPCNATDIWMRSKPPASTSTPSYTTPNTGSAPTAQATPPPNTASPASPCWPANLRLNPTTPDITRGTIMSITSGPRSGTGNPRNRGDFG